MKPICLLETHIINQIAAGEVVERPASVLKELMENAIDAQATVLRIRWRQGGQSVIEVDDNGHGIEHHQIRLALARHATSKLQTVSDLRSIHTFGFRGEALAAMTSIARVTLTTRHTNDAHGWSIYVEAGQEKQWQPAPRDCGTCVAVHDLFFATPARLKFMRSIQLEQHYLWDTVYKMALSHPNVHITVSTETRTTAFPTGEEQRMGLVLGHDFAANSVILEHEHDSYRLRGRLSLPTHNRANADKMFFDVNGRSVQDKMLSMAVRLAYRDTLPKGRHPVGWISLSVPHADVDVNVHPAKTEVRFVDPRRLKHWVQSVIQDTLWTHGMHAAGWRPSSLETVASEEVETPTPWDPPREAVKTVSSVAGQPMGQPLVYQPTLQYHSTTTHQPTTHQPTTHPSMVHGGDGSLGLLAPAMVAYESPERTVSLATTEQYTTPNPAGNRGSKDNADCAFMPHPAPCSAPSTSSCLLPVDLGQAVAQIHQRYIVAKTATHLVLVDQHAAHERIVYEYIKNQWGQELGHVVPFLIPTQWVEEPDQCEAIHHARSLLNDLGFAVQIQGDHVRLHSIPMIFQAYDPERLFKDLMSCVREGEDAPAVLERWRNHILGNWACRHSIRGGDVLSIPAMNALLRTLERTPNGAQCNHGRCVYRQWNSQSLSLFFQ